MTQRVRRFAIAAVVAAASAASTASAQRGPITEDQVAAAVVGVTALRVRLAPEQRILVGRFARGPTDWRNLHSRVVLALGPAPAQNDSAIRCDHTRRLCPRRPMMVGMYVMGATVAGDTAQVYVMTEDLGGVNEGVGLLWRIIVVRAARGWSAVKVENVGQS